MYDMYFLHRTTKTKLQLNYTENLNKIKKIGGGGGGQLQFKATTTLVVFMRKHFLSLTQISCLA